MVFLALALFLQSLFYTLALTAPYPLAPLALPLSLSLSDPGSNSSFLTNQSSTSPPPTTPPEPPYYYRVPGAPFSIVFFNYGGEMVKNDAIEAVQAAWIDATSVHHQSREKMGTSQRYYKSNDVYFFVTPQERLEWGMFHYVTFGIMQVLQQKFHNETEFIIFGDGYEGNLGRGFLSDE